MCVTEIYTDRYPNGTESRFSQTLLCSLGEPGRPCMRHTTDRRPARNIQYGEPTTEFMLLSPRSSTSSSRPSSHELGIEIPSEGRERRRRRRSSGLLFDAFFGDGSSRNRTHTRRRAERVIYVDTPPSPSPIASPRFAPGYYSSSPRSPRFADDAYFAAPPSPPARPIIRDASPARGRGRNAPPIIHDERRQQRASSTEGVVGARSPTRQPSAATPAPVPSTPQPSYAEVREREARAASAERRRARDERAARLAAEVEAERARRRREHLRALENAEIEARLPTRPRRLAGGGARPVVAQEGRPIQELFGEMDLNGRGERVIAQAAAERWRGEMEDDAGAQRERLRRRFTVGGGGGGGRGALDARERRRDRIVYDTGYRY